MVGSLPPYPYLTHIENMRAKSTLQLANLSMVNAQYRRNSPNYHAFSDPSPKLSPAQKQLQDYQNTLHKIANPYAAEGRGYQPLRSSALPPQNHAGIGALLSQLHAQGHSSPSYTGGGSRYVLAHIALKQNSPSESNYSSKSRHGTEYRLHYYQDSRQEIVLLQDISGRNTERSLRETPRGILNAMQRRHAILGATSPALYQSGMMQAGIGYNTDQDLILVRKAGETQYHASNINETGIGTYSEAKDASNFLQQKLARLAKTQEIQNSVDRAIAAGSHFVIATPRSQINLETIRKNSKDMSEFFPGLRQGFGFNNSADNRLAASQVLGDHYRMKYLSRAQIAPEAIARAYSNGGINPALYTNHAMLQKSRLHSQKLPTALPEDRDINRYQHLRSDGVLQFSNFHTLISDSHNSHYAGEDRLVAGSMGLVDAPIRLGTPTAPSLSPPPSQPARGFNLASNIAGSILSRLSGLVDMTATNQLVGQTLGLGMSGGYRALLEGNIDVSSTLIQGLTSASSDPTLYTINAARIGAHSSSGINVDWQPNQA